MKSTRSQNQNSFHTRAAVFAAGVALLASAAALPLLTASCATQKAKADSPEAAERLRALTRTDALPAEADVASIEREYAGTRTGALARILRARVRAAAGDYAGAASLLDSRDLREHTRISDYALFLRADALEKAGRTVEARAAYEKLARDFPDSLRAREATLRGAKLALQDAPSAVPTLLKKLADADDPQALLLTAQAYEQSGEQTRALGAYRRLHFYAPANSDSDTIISALQRLNSSPDPASAEEATARAERLFAAKRYSPALDAYTQSFSLFPETATPQAQLRRGQAAFQMRRPAETVASLTAVPADAGDLRAEALNTLAQHYARAKQWPSLRTTVEELRRAFPQSDWTKRVLVQAGQAAKDAKNTADANYFFRTAVSSFPGAPEVAPAQFELAWAAHDAKNFAESSRLFVEHLADYADRNTDFRGRAGYWAARDSQRAGRAAEARALYEAMQVRYEANWYGQLARQRLDAMPRAAATEATGFAPDSPVARAVANLRPVTVAEERAGPAEDERVARAEELDIVGLGEYAHAEFDKALESAPASPRVSLAKARVHRSRGENLEAFRVLARSFPDYSQMEVEELTPEQWDVFYPLAFWETIRSESKARSLDPYTVAGLIRQESVFNPRAASHADAYGLMQLLVPTARPLARRLGVEFPASEGAAIEALYDPALNVKLGALYLRDNLDRFGRIEYVAAAYNAGPGRAVEWRASLPPEMDEWAEAVPFRETRGYVQGVVRNTLQYRRLYDEQGRFRPAVGAQPAAAGQPGVNVRRLSNDEEEE